LLPLQVPPLAAPAVDPIFAAIDEHKIAELDRCERIHGDADGSITEKPCHDENVGPGVLRVAGGEGGIGPATVIDQAASDIGAGIT